MTEKRLQARKNVVSAGPYSSTGFVKKIEVLKCVRRYLDGYYILQQFRICPENGGTEMHTGYTQMTITLYTSQLLSCEFSFYSDYSNLQITYNSLQLQFSPTGQHRHLCPSIEYLHTHRNQS
ncbi:hypothetical protein V8G54_024008 [Vigna mungo]|uniref:Uncharacterized protein n=1 Tax=Vigna mungo TaxID=3915 RepID=A0AAQ3N634_VIGMU